MSRWLVVLLAVSFVGCKKKPPEVVVDAGPRVIATAPTQEQAVRDMVSNFSRVHFETDSSKLDDSGKAALAANASIMQSFPEIKVEVQGHADERGTIDYNLALGQRRAKSVVEYLSSQGVASSRLPVVSYGEERPADDRTGAVAWAVNRRAEFRVLSGTPAVQGTTAQ